MRIFSYRNKRTVRRILLILGVVLAVLLALVIGRFIYLQRFISYTSEGARLDYEQDLTMTGQTPAARDPAQFPFETVLEENGGADGEPQTRKKLTGFHVTTDMLLGGIDEVKNALRQSEDYNTVLLDVKSSYGNFYYSTRLSGMQKTDALDVAEVDRFIRELTETRDLTVIARFSAFRDRNFALANQSDALPIWNGALWEGDDLCYWLNPYSKEVQGYLTSVAIELAQLGFDGVLFDDFYFPDSDRIMWNGSISKEEAVLDCAAALGDLNGYGIEILFGSDSPEVAAYADRICIRSEQAEDVPGIVEQMQPIMEDPAAQIVFLTDSRDTRFAQCGVLRPLIEAEEPS